MDKKNCRIVFMGTPEFAVESLKELITYDYHVVSVVTAPDKPAGRGQKLQESEVKKFAVKNGLPVLQPEKLRDNGFINQLKSLEPDLMIVVAFRMLPEEVWRIPALGTFNLHASLLPQYRGAAPINHVIINGERKTGVTTFFIDKEIDTGNIILQEEVLIDEHETAGDLHDKLMETGASLVIKTVDLILSGHVNKIEQSTVPGITGLKAAPKISKEFCKINWDRNIDEVYDFIRGLSPYPAAFTEIKKENEVILLKIFKTVKIYTEHSLKPGTINTDNKSYLNIAVNQGFISIKELQLAGKKKMGIEEFLRGFKNITDYCII